MEYGYYHPELGYWQTNSEPSEDTIKSYAEGTKRVALRPSPLHTFADGVWQEPTQAELDAAAAAQVRAERDNRLLEVDAIAGNALRWAGIWSQAAWSAYRQALLDVPQQSGFPHDITWPTKPE